MVGGAAQLHVMSLKKEETLGLMGGALQKPGGKQLGILSILVDGQGSVAFDPR